MDRQYAQPLTYTGCSGESLVLFIFLIVTMIIIVLVLKLFLYSELYRHDGHCYPVLYYFGQTDGCRQYVGKYARWHAQLAAAGGGENAQWMVNPQNRRQGAETFIGDPRRAFSYLWDAYLAGVTTLVQTLNWWKHCVQEEWPLSRL